MESFVSLYQDLISSYGSLGVFFLSFLAATLLPFSSELILLTGIKTGIPQESALIAASLGNCLGCLFNYGLGFLFADKAEAKLISSRAGRLAVKWMKDYGTWSLLGSWLPVIGDPLTIVGGLMKVQLWKFIFIVFTLRILRYLAVAGVF
ncbi:DedA family protein [bacterium]|nr:MAG: DedA family protein [bacterium]